MAVKKQTVQAPPMWKSGGKYNYYSIEVLEAERALIISRAKEARKEIGFYKFTERVKEVKRWESLAERLKAGIDILKAVMANRAQCMKLLNDPAITKAVAFAARSLGEPYKPDETAKVPPHSKSQPAIHEPIDPAKEKAANDAAEKSGCAAAPKVRANCKKFAKCGEFSYTHCFNKCEKRKDGTCNLIRGSQAKPKKMAKCNDHSYWYCFTSCDKRKKKKCNLVRKYTRGKK